MKRKHFLSGLVAAVVMGATGWTVWACCGPYCQNPSLSVTCAPSELWPPNHKYVDIAVAYTTNVSAGGTVRIIDAVSSEPDNAEGDGNTTADIVITGDLTVKARAERQGGGVGRTYTIIVEARQPPPCQANFTLASCMVFVPHDQG